MGPLLLLLAALTGLQQGGSSSLVEPAVPSSKWVAKGDIRPELADPELLVGFRLQVDAQGAVTGCDLFAPAGIAEVDAATCAVLSRRARFRPMPHLPAGMTSASYLSWVRWAKRPELLEARNGQRDRSGLLLAVPVEDPRPWLRDLPYPRAARLTATGGIVHITLLVAADGSVTGCRVIESSGSRLLDSAGCEAMQARGRFYPAVDGWGRPADGGWSVKVVWKP